MTTKVGGKTKREAVQDASPSAGASDALSDLMEIAKKRKRPTGEPIHRLAALRRYLDDLLLAEALVHHQPREALNLVFTAGWRLTEGVGRDDLTDLFRAIACALSDHDLGRTPTMFTPLRASRDGAKRPSKREDMARNLGIATLDRLRSECKLSLEDAAAAVARILVKNRIHFTSSQLIDFRKKARQAAGRGESTDLARFRNGMQRMPPGLSLERCEEALLAALDLALAEKVRNLP